jgi:hypothetical protein
VVWTLANRAGKYWHESWESKLTREHPTIAQLFEFEPVQDRKGFFSARAYSVSRLAIALSDFSTLLWLGLVLTMIVKASAAWHSSRLSSTLGISFAAISIVMAIFLVCGGWKSFRVSRGRDPK